MAYPQDIETKKIDINDLNELIDGFIDIFESLKDIANNLNKGGE